MLLLSPQLMRCSLCGVLQSTLEGDLRPQDHLLFADDVVAIEYLVSVCFDCAPVILALDAALQSVNQAHAAYKSAFLLVHQAQDFLSTLRPAASRSDIQSATRLLFATLAEAERLLFTWELQGQVRDLARAAFDARAALAFLEA